MPLFFARENKQLLGLYMQPDHLDHILTCMDAEPPIDPHPAKLSSCLKSCEIATVLFEGLQKKMHYTLYVAEIEHQLAVLERNDFVADEIASYTTLMQREADSVHGLLFKEFQSKGAGVGYLGVRAKVKMTHAEDEYTFRLAGKARTVAINAGDIKAYPWEAASLPIGSLPDTPKTIRVPEEALSKTRNCRDAFLSMCGSTLLTLTDYKKEYHKNLTSLKALDRFCLLELWWLEHEAEPALKKKIEADVLAALPSFTSKVSFSKVMVWRNVNVKLLSCVQICYECKMF
jgi:hypothetical protein